MLFYFGRFQPQVTLIRSGRFGRLSLISKAWIIRKLKLIAVRASLRAGVHPKHMKNIVANKIEIKINVRDNDVLFR